MSRSKAKNRPGPVWARWLTAQVLALGLVSLFTDVSSEMIVPLLPVFVTTVLGGGAIAVGLIDGAGDFARSLLQVFAGRRVDASGKHRSWMLFGYSVSSLARPVIGLVTAPWQVVALRMADRAGKGVRSSPRDSLLAEQATPSTRGKVFGFHRAMDHLGAVLGPLLALALLALLHGDLRRIFLWAIVPGALAVTVIILLVHEAQPSARKAQRPAWSWAPPREISPFLWPVAIFSLGASSDMFLLLKASQADAPLFTLPLLWMGLHGVKVASSLIGGPLVDRFGAKRTISVGWAVYVIIYAALALAKGPGQVAALFMVYGIYHGLTEGPEKAMLAGMAKASSKATAFGWYGFVTGSLALPAGLLFGWLWESAGAEAAFLSGAFFALGALALLWLHPGLKGKGGIMRAV